MVGVPKKMLPLLAVLSSSEWTDSTLPSSSRSKTYSIDCTSLGALLMIPKRFAAKIEVVSNGLKPSELYGSFKM